MIVWAYRCRSEAKMFKVVDESVTPIDDYSATAVAIGRGFAMVKECDCTQVYGRFASKGAASRAVNRRNKELAQHQGKY